MATQGVGHKVLVSDLPGDCAEEEVRIVFATYGKVVSIQMLQAGQDGLRSAVVLYDSEEAAEDAEDALSGVYSIRHNVQRPIRVQRQGAQAPQASAAPAPAAAAAAHQERGERPQAAEAPRRVPMVGSAARQDGVAGQLVLPPPRQVPMVGSAARPNGAGGTKIWTEAGMVESHKLFVGSLPPDVTEEEMKTVFGTYGVVLRVILLSSHPLKGRSAFVMYKDREAGDDAIEVLNDVYKLRPSFPFPMQVRWAAKAQRRDGWEAAVWSSGGGWDAWQGGDWSGGWVEDFRGGWPGGKPSSSWAGPSAGWEESSWSGAGGSSWSGAGGSSWSAAGGKGKGKKVAPPEQRGAPERTCPSPGCKYLVTWHGTHCCQVCEYYPGAGDHGPRCEKRLQGQAGCGKGGSSASTAHAGAADASGTSVAAPAADAGGGVSQAASSCVHVFANLPSDVDERGLKHVFETYGHVTNVRMERDQATGRAEAFVDYGTAWDAETSVMSLDNQYEIRKGFGPIRVKLAHVRSEKAPY